MGIRNLLARVSRFDGETFFVFLATLGVLYAYPAFVFVRAGHWPDLLGWIGLALWGRLGWWFVKGVFFGGFNGEPANRRDRGRDRRG